MKQRRLMRYSASKRPSKAVVAGRFLETSQLCILSGRYRSASPRQFQIMIVDHYFVKESDPEGKIVERSGSFQWRQNYLPVFLLPSTSPFIFILVAIRHTKPARKANTMQTHCCCWQHFFSIMNFVPSRNLALHAQSPSLEDRLKQENDPLFAQPPKRIPGNQISSLCLALGRSIIKIMSVINLNFEQFVREVERKGPVGEATEKAESMYCLKAHKISEITSAHALQIYESIYLKFYKSHSQLISTNWYENQLRIFVWALACYIYLHSTIIEHLGQKDWDFFSTMFDHKDPKLFEYQCHAICQGSKSRAWTEEEEKLLKKVVQYFKRQLRNRNHATKWNEVSKLLFHGSEKKYFRTAKQCRQRWNNHLDPSKIKGYWKAEQCLLLFNFVKESGKKWASLVKIMKNTRNEHSIKNKFNSILRKHMKLSACTKEDDVYDEIIERINKSIASKANFDTRDGGLDFEQFSQWEQQSPRNDHIDKNCHQVTQNFLKKLLNFQNCTQEQNLTPSQNQLPHVVRGQPNLMGHQWRALMGSNVGQLTFYKNRPNCENSRISEQRVEQFGVHSGNKEQSLNIWREWELDKKSLAGNWLGNMLYWRMNPDKQIKAAWCEGQGD